MDDTLNEKKVDINDSENNGKLTESEIFSLNFGVLFRSLVLYGLFLAYYFDWISWYILIICDIVIYPAIYLHIHDLGHGSPSRKIWFTSFNPLVSDPIWGGLRVFRYTHLQHHRFFGTKADPWLPYYDGHPLVAFFWNYFESEYSGYRYIKDKGVDKKFILNCTINLVLLAQIFIFGFSYLLHLFALRTVRAIAIYFFNYFTHRSSFSKNADYGVYEREHDLRFILPALRLLWGRVLVNGLIYHNRHHSIKNWSIPVKHYEKLVDEGIYTIYQDKWPIHEIKDLKK